MARPTIDPLTALAQQGSRHHGVVTLADAAALGVTRAQLRTAIGRGSWRRVGRGVLVAPAAPRTWDQRVMIAVAACGGVASHRCAARLHRLDGFGDAPVEVTLERNGSPPSGGVIAHRTTRWDPESITTISGIPAMSIARTLVDLGAVVDDDQVEQALDDALRQGCNLRWITQVLDSAMRPGPSGCAALRRVLARPDRSGPIPDSRFERLVERLVTTHGFPEPERQVPIRSGDRIVARVDAGWVATRSGSRPTPNCGTGGRAAVGWPAHATTCCRRSAGRCSTPAGRTSTTPPTCSADWSPSSARPAPPPEPTPS